MRLAVVVSGLALGGILLCSPGCASSPSSNVEDNASQDANMTGRTAAAAYTNPRQIVPSSRASTPGVSYWTAYAVDEGLVAFAVDENADVAYGVFLNKSTGKISFDAYDRFAKTDEPVSAALGESLAADFATLRVAAENELQRETNQELSCVIAWTVVGLATLATAAAVVTGFWLVAGIVETGLQATAAVVGLGTGAAAGFGIDGAAAAFVADGLQCGGLR